MLKLRVFGAFSKSNAVAISCWVYGRLCTVAKLAVFTNPTTTKVRGVAGADVVVKGFGGAASTAV